MPVAQLPVLLTPPPGRFALCTRRQWLALTLGAGAANALALPVRTLQFPRDHGSHPDLHTEWWYLKRVIIEKNFPATTCHSLIGESQ